MKQSSFLRGFKTWIGAALLFITIYFVFRLGFNSQKPSDTQAKCSTSTNEPEKYAKISRDYFRYNCKDIRRLGGFPDFVNRGKISPFLALKSFTFFNMVFSIFGKKSTR